MIHLESISLKRDTSDLPDRYPFNLPLLRNFTELKFRSSVTFIVGENGSGKSTLMESLACSINAITVGAQSVKTDPTLESARELAKILRMSWIRKTNRGFFLRAEDFFGYAKAMAKKEQELREDLADAEERFKGRSAFVMNQARAAYVKEINGIRGRYGDGLDAGSHGECFLKLFQERFIPNGLYLLDEPEVPLSPLRQLSLLSMLKDMVDENAQFIIATHSPILAAFPGAVLLSLDSDGLQEIAYDEFEHVRLTKAFLNDPESYLRRLWD